MVEVPTAPPHEMQQRPLVVLAGTMTTMISIMLVAWTVIFVGWFLYMVPILEVCKILVDMILYYQDYGTWAFALNSILKGIIDHTTSSQ